MSLDNEKQVISPTEVSALVSDLTTPKPLIYWADYLFSVTLAWSAFYVAFLSADFSALQGAAYIVSCLALYRAVIFTHELTHLKKGTFQIFRWVWNFTTGFVVMAPSFAYQGVHNDHHKRKVYGLADDGEYLPFGAGHPFHIIAYLAQVLFLPPLVLARALILTPLSYLSKRVRKFTWEQASSLVIDPAYRRPAPTRHDDPTWRLQEFLSFVYAASFAALFASGTWPLRVFILWYAVMVLVFLLNSLRTLAAHAYRNPGDRVMDHTEQFLDSVNVPGNRFVTTFWAPLGLRYHATHHLVPAMPYHALGEAHRRLSRDLTSRDVYNQATRRSLVQALWHLWCDARAATDEKAAAAE